METPIIKYSLIRICDTDKMWKGLKEEGYGLVLSRFGLA